MKCSSDILFYSLKYGLIHIFLQIKRLFCSSPVCWGLWSLLQTLNHIQLMRELYFISTWTSKKNIYQFQTQNGRTSYTLLVHLGLVHIQMLVCVLLSKRIQFLHLFKPTLSTWLIPGWPQHYPWKCFLWDNWLPSCYREHFYWALNYL